MANQRVRVMTGDHCGQEGVTISGNCPLAEDGTKFAAGYIEVRIWNGLPTGMCMQFLPFHLSVLESPEDPPEAPLTTDNMGMDDVPSDGDGALPPVQHPAGVTEVDMSTPPILTDNEAEADAVSPSHTITDEETGARSPTSIHTPPEEEAMPSRLLCATERATRASRPAPSTRCGTCEPRCERPRSPEWQTNVCEL